VLPLAGAETVTVPVGSAKLRAPEHSARTRTNLLISVLRS
jgi:hypothetical protein